jgi:hypothetical protein
MGIIDLQFEYDLPKKIVYDWWTDLSPKGYIGKALKSIKKIREEDGKILVETHWQLMGRNRTMQEKLSLLSEDHWIWEPEMGFGIQITDDFTLTTLEDGKVQLKIHSIQQSTGFEGRLTQFLMGRVLRRHEARMGSCQPSNASRVIHQEGKS